MTNEKAGILSRRTAAAVLIVQCLPLIFAGALRAAVTPEFQGYIENRFFTTFMNSDFRPSRFKDNIRWGDYNRARVEMAADVSEKSYINLTVDHFIYKGYLLRFLRNPDTGADPVEADEDQRISIDRAYIRLYFSRADVTIGQQRISWGQSLLWSPFDVFNRINVFEPQEEKSGISAFRVQVPLGMTSAFDIVLAPESTLDESRAGARLIWNMLGSEFTVSGIHNVVNSFSQNIAGIGLKTDLLFGLWFEGSFFDEQALPGKVYPEQEYRRWLFGLDYSHIIFDKRLYVMAEFSHDDSGEKHKPNYDYLMAQIRGRSFMAEDYLYASAQLTQSEFTGLHLAFIRNVNDGGMYVIPGITHSLFPNTELRVGAYLPVAARGTEFNPGFSYAGNSIIYCWFKLFM